MIIIRFIFVFLIFHAAHSYAANIYVDGGTVEADATWSEVNGESYTSTDENFPGAGTGYDTVIAGVAAMSDSDDLYIRGGTYVGRVVVGTGLNGTSEDWVTIQSYPGEWAIIDGNQTSGSNGYAFGNNAYSHDYSELNNRYIKIERIEVKNGQKFGIWLHGGPFIIRYCYVHNNGNDYDEVDQMGGITGYIWRDSIVEYNYLANNGKDDNHAANFQVFSDYDPCGDWSDETAGVCDIEDAYHNVEVRYNFFDMRSYGYWAIHDKARQVLSRYDSIDYTYEEEGNRYHHNVCLTSNTNSKVIGGTSDFLQVYNNIIWMTGSNNDVAINQGDTETYRGNQGCVYYNNTVYGGRFKSNFGELDTYNNFTDTPYIWLYNNIFDSTPPDYDGSRDITIGNAYIDDIDYQSEKVDIDKNYLYRTASGDQVHVADIGNVSMATFDTTYSKDNAVKASSEGSDNLYSGASGSDQYITRGSHSTEGAETIADGGIGGNHPYLSGVTIPSYIGATDPDDNSWVDGVLSMDSAWFTNQTAGSTPNWIEGAANASFSGSGSSSFGGSGSMTIE
jgi:hypothetical protein